VDNSTTGLAREIATRKVNAVVETTTTTTTEMVGPLLEVLPVLLAEGRTDEVLAAVRALVARNEKLERQLASMLRPTSKSNEGVSSDQLLLFLDRLRAATKAEDNLGETEVDARLLARADAAGERAREKALSEGKKPKQLPLKKPLPADLPRRENVIDIPEAERACPTCGSDRDVCGDEIAEVLELEPAKLYVRRDVRIKRACRQCESKVVCAPRGQKVVQGGQIGCSVVAQLLHDKYDRGLPLHRQRKDFARLGIELPTSTLCDQVKWAAELLRPIWLEAIDQVLEADVMHIDGTGVKVLDRDHPDGKRAGTFWGTVGADAGGPKVAAYFYAATKKAKAQRPDELGPTDILALRTGITVADADTLFTAQMRRDDVIDCGCNMHARRYFIKAVDGGDDRAALVVGAFKGLYQVEDDARLLSAEGRLELRRSRSSPIYDDIVAWCRHHERDTLPKSPLGRAIAYLLRHEEALRRFETDGTIPIDNAAAEHGFVPVALTRKNYLFLGHDNGGDRAAIIYTILRCCRLAGVDPVVYLRETLGILAGKVRRAEMSELMPAAWRSRTNAA
jgi:transposase